MPRKNIFIFIFFLSLCLLVYRNCFHIFIPADNYSQAYWFKDGFFSGCITSFYEHTPPHLIWFPVFSFLYYLFGINSVCWISTSVFFHALNAFVGYLLAEKIIMSLTGERNRVIPFFASFIFLISPFQTEDVLWAPISVRWLLNVSVIYLGILIFISSLDKPSSRKIILLHVLFLIGIFLNEPALVLPAAYAVLFFLFWRTQKNNLPAKKFFSGIIFPQVVFIVFYFFVNHLWSGHWLWHDGTFADISQSFNFPKTILKYFAKFFLFYRYFSSDELDLLLRNFSANIFFVIALFLAGVSLAGFFFWKILKRKKEDGIFLLAIFSCFLVFLLPVLFIDSSFLKYIYPDRYGYPASFFFYFFLASCGYFLFKNFSVVLLTAYSILCFVLLEKTIPVWISTNNYCAELVQNYQPFPRYERVYVLGLPSYYNGLAAFRSAFEQNIFYAYNSPLEKIEMIAGYYFESPADSILSAKISDAKIEVKGVAKKTPFFSTGAGWPKSHETDEYKVEFDSAGSSYILTFKHEIPPNSALIYSSGDNWKKIN
ncbi:MAG: hypothetical protein HY063_02745 [Bacteroidetes bacterium]|nr:hypothetical protein [Bacteroidota bacterium]